MSTTKKVLTIIFSVLIVGAFAFVLTWGIINWSKVKEGMSGNGLYTQEDIQNAFEDGYGKALADKAEYEKLINSYKDTITTQSMLVTQYKNEALALTNSNKEYQSQVDGLSEQRTALEEQVNLLNAIKADNEDRINELDGQIQALSARILELESNKSENESEITRLTERMTELQELNAQLQESNEINVRTITSLNERIAELDEQILGLSAQVQNNAMTVNTLQAKIDELQKSVDYYERFFSALDLGEQVLATFEFDGSVYDVQIVDKESVLSVEAPQSTAYVIFNGWTVNGATVNLATYKITTNTRFIADVTYKQEATFMVDNEHYTTQIVLRGEKLRIPTAPSKAGYVFDGWWLDGNLAVDFDTFTLEQNATLVAKFTKLHSVVFKYEENTMSSQTVKNGLYAQAPKAITTAYKVFRGWKVNDVTVDVENYRITEDTVFVADIMYRYAVRFVADGRTHNAQIVTKNECAVVPANPIKDNHVFVGWSIDGTNTVDVGIYAITDNVNFTAIFRVDKFTVTFMNGDAVLDTQEVLNGSYAEVPDFDAETFLGWTIDGTVVDVSTYVVLADTVFTAKYGTWTRVGENAYYVYGNSQMNSAEVHISGLKAGDKIRITAHSIKANISDTGDNSYWFNSSDGNGCYGWMYDGNGGWSGMDESENITGDFGEKELSSLTPFVSTLGCVNYEKENTFTVCISCKRDGYLTVEWDDEAGFYIEMMMLWEMYVVR